MPRRRDAPGPTSKDRPPAARRAAPWADAAVLGAGPRRRLADARRCWRPSSCRWSIGAMPAIREFGLAFLWRSEWDPVQNRYGGLVMIYGTLMTSFIALLIAVPVSFGIALFLTELSPLWLKRPLGTAIELLAAVPSIVYGMWGLLVFSPILSQYVQQPLQSVFSGVPLLGAAVLGAARGHRPAVGGDHPGDHGDPVHRLGDARRLRGDAADAQGVGLRARLDHLGGGLERRAAVHQDRRGRRHHARPRPRASARRWP